MNITVSRHDPVRVFTTEETTVAVVGAARAVACASTASCVVVVVVVVAASEHCHSLWLGCNSSFLQPLGFIYGCNDSLEINIGYPPQPHFQLPI